LSALFQSQFQEQYRLTQSQKESVPWSFGISILDAIYISPYEYTISLYIESTHALLRKVVVGVEWIIILDVQGRLATPTGDIILVYSIIVHLTSIAETARL
jgi:hypothetical protein